MRDEERGRVWKRVDASRRYVMREESEKEGGRKEEKEKKNDVEWGTIMSRRKR